MCIHVLLFGGGGGSRRRHQVTPQNKVLSAIPYKPSAHFSKATDMNIELDEVPLKQFVKSDIHLATLIDSDKGSDKGSDKEIIVKFLHSQEEETKHIDLAKRCALLSVKRSEKTKNVDFCTYSYSSTMKVIKSSKSIILSIGSE